MKDQLNRTITLNTIPRRIISLVPSQTELLVDLGLEDSVVGITKFCVHPSYLKATKTVVGGTKQVHFDKIKSLDPDIILCNKEENTKDMIEELEKIAPVHVSDIYTLEDALELIKSYGLIFSKENSANDIVGEIVKKKRDFQIFIKDKSKKSIAYFIWKQPWMVAGKDNFIDEILRLNGWDNYYSPLKRYPEVILNEKRPESADMVFLSTEPYPFNKEHIPEIQSYFPNATILVVDGEMFSWYGSRLIKAFDYFKKLHQYP